MFDGKSQIINILSWGHLRLSVCNSVSYILSISNVHAEPLIVLSGVYYSNHVFSWHYDSEFVTIKKKKNMCFSFKTVVFNNCENFVFILEELWNFKCSSCLNLSIVSPSFFCLLFFLRRSNQIVSQKLYFMAVVLKFEIIIHHLFLYIALARLIIISYRDPIIDFLFIYWFVLFEELFYYLSVYMRYGSVRSN